MAMLTVELTDEEHRALKLLAVRRGTSMSRIVRDLLSRELSSLSGADRAAAAEWTRDTARSVLGITADTDPAVHDAVTAAMAAAERDADAVYGRPQTGAA